jgi:hypothetical protein
MTTRLPRPILTLLTILSIAGSLSMMNQSAASTVPILGTEGPTFKCLQMLRGQSQVGPSPALNRGESHAIRSAGLNQDDGPPHSVRMREGTLPRPTNVRGAGHDGTHGHSEALCLV